MKVEFVKDHSKVEIGLGDVIEIESEDFRYIAKIGGKIVSIDLEDGHQVVSFDNLDKLNEYYNKPGYEDKKVGRIIKLTLERKY